MVTSSDDFKVCECEVVTRSSSKKLLIVYEAAQLVLALAKLQVDSDTTCVSNACIKTLLLCCYCIVLLAFACTYVRIDNPSR